MSNVQVRWSYVYNQGYDTWPGPNDLDAFDTREDAERDLKTHCRAFGYPEEHYDIVHSMVTDWVKAP